MLTRERNGRKRERKRERKSERHSTRSPAGGCLQEKGTVERGKEKERERVRDIVQGPQLEEAYKKKEGKTERQREREREGERERERERAQGPIAFCFGFVPCRPGAASQNCWEYSSSWHKWA